MLCVSDMIMVRGVSVRQEIWLMSLKNVNGFIYIELYKARNSQICRHRAPQEVHKWGEQRTVDLRKIFVDRTEHF